MKIIGIVGSPRTGGNSFCLVNEALAAAREAESSTETEIIQLGDFRIQPCKACETCGQFPFKCVQSDDFEIVLDKMKEADAVLIASPRYGPFGASPSILQALLERLMNVSYLPKHTDPGFIPPLKGKPCGLVAVSVEGRQNLLPVLHSLEQYVLAYGMRVVHTSEWPYVGVAGRGNAPGDVLEDEDAMKAARTLGRLMVRWAKMRTLWKDS